MALDETAEVRIARPADEVAAYMFDPANDPANDPAWISGISEAEPLGPPPIDVGCRWTSPTRSIHRPRAPWRASASRATPGGCTVSPAR